MKNDPFTTNETCPICGGSPRVIRAVVRAHRIAICDSCKSGYRVPRPKKEELAAIYTRDYYNAWGLNTSESISLRTKKATFSRLLKKIKPVPNQDSSQRVKLLDVGGATGILLSTAQENGWDVYATEINPYAAGVLKNTFGPANIFEGELPDCTFESASFDIITMTDVIEHVYVVQQYFSVAKRLLRPGGVLLLTTPRIDSFSMFIMQSQWLHFKEEHLQYFSAEGLKNCMENAGFKNISIHPYTKWLTPEYLHAQLQAYPHRILTPLISTANRILPPKVKAKPMPYRCGEMVAVGNA